VGSSSTGSITSPAITVAPSAAGAAASAAPCPAGASGDDHDLAGDPALGGHQPPDALWRIVASLY
jgi:hypothetical protein